VQAVPRRGLCGVGYLGPLSFPALALTVLAACSALLHGSAAVAKAPTYDPPCSAQQLQAADAGTKSFDGRRVTKIDVINNSAKPCSLQGYPQLSFSLLSGAPTFVLVNKTAVDANYKTPGPSRIDIASLQRASFLLGYPKMKARGNGCVPVSNIGIDFDAHLQFGTVNLPDTIASCGTVNESPFFVSKPLNAPARR
jgi:hypothetical protein